MSFLNTILIAAGALVIGGLLFFGLGCTSGNMHNGNHSFDMHGISGEQVDNHDDLDGDMLYVCPMHPEITSTDPDERCSICGMNLEPGEMMGDHVDQDH